MDVSLALGLRFRAPRALLLGQRLLDLGTRTTLISSRRRCSLARKCRNCAQLLRAGAALPAETEDGFVQKVIAAGSFQNYERDHLNALAASFVPKFSHLLPPEMVRHVVEYAFHVGDY